MEYHFLLTLVKLILVSLVPIASIVFSNLYIR